MRSIYRGVQTLALICLAFGLSACLKSYSLDGWDEFSSTPIPIVCEDRAVDQDELVARAKQATLAHMKQDDRDYWEKVWDYLKYASPTVRYHTTPDRTLLGIMYYFNLQGIVVWGDGGIMMLFDPCTLEVHDLSFWMPSPEAYE